MFSGLRTSHPDSAFLLPQLKRLQEAGHTVALMAPADRAYAELARSTGFEVFSWPTYGKLDVRNIFKLARLFRRFEADIVDTHLSTAALHSAFAGRLARVPVVSTVHATNSATCFRFSSALIAVSDAVREHMSKQGIPANRIFTVRNGLDTDWFHMPEAGAGEEFRAGLEIGPDTQLISVVGRLTERKGHRVLLHALPQLLSGGVDVHVAIAGEGPLKAALADLAAELGVSGRVHLLGLLKDVRPLLWASQVYAMPSLYGEGLSKALLQAMACGVPVVATDIPGVREAVTDNETGLLPPPDNVEALTAALLRILKKEPELRDRLIEQARKTVETDFSSARVASELAEVYAEVRRKWLARRR